MPRPRAAALATQEPPGGSRPPVERIRDVLRSAEGISPSSAELGSSLWAARRSLGSSTKAGEVSANSAALWMAARDQHVAASTKTSALPVVAWAVNEIANTGYRPVGGATQYY